MPPDPMPEFPAAWIDIVARALHAVICTKVDCLDLPSFHAPAHALLAALLAADALVTPPGMRAVAGDVEPLAYVSTACQHGFHERCRLQCKFCPSACGCPRHGDATAACGAPDHDQQVRAVVLREACEVLDRIIVDYPIEAGPASGVTGDFHGWALDVGGPQVAEPGAAEFPDA